MCPTQCLLVFITLFCYAHSVKLQEYFKQCQRNDPNLNQCIIDSFNGGALEFIKGDSKRHLATLSPLYVPVMYIDVDGNLKINITENYLSGFDTIKLIQVSWDWEKKMFDGHITFDYTNFLGHYDIHGRLMILPIYGQGPCNLTYVKPDYHFTFEFNIQEQHQKEYLNIHNCTISFEIERAIYKLENLYNGQSTLSKQMNKILDENWRDVNVEIGAKVGDALANVFCIVLRGYFEKVSVNELFG